MAKDFQRGNGGQLMVIKGEQTPDGIG